MLVFRAPLVKIKVSLLDDPIEEVDVGVAEQALYGAIELLQPLGPIDLGLVCGLATAGLGDPDADGADVGRQLDLIASLGQGQNYLVELTSVHLVRLGGGAVQQLLEGGGLHALDLVDGLLFHALVQQEPDETGLALEVCREGVPFQRPAVRDGG